MELSSNLATAAAERQRSTRHARALKYPITSPYTWEEAGVRVKSTLRQRLLMPRVAAATNCPCSPMDRADCITNSAANSAVAIPEKDELLQVPRTFAFIFAQTQNAEGKQLNESLSSRQNNAPLQQFPNQQFPNMDLTSPHFNKFQQIVNTCVEICWNLLKFGFCDVVFRSLGCICFVLRCVVDVYARLP